MLADIFTIAVSILLLAVAEAALYPQPVTNSWAKRPLYPPIRTSGPRRYAEETSVYLQDICSTTCVAEINESAFEEQYLNESVFGRTYCGFGYELDEEKRDTYIAAESFEDCQEVCCKKIEAEPDTITCLYHDLRASGGEPVCAKSNQVVNTDLNFQKTTKCSQDPHCPGEYSFCGSVCCEETGSRCNAEGQEYAGNLMCVYYSLAQIEKERGCKESNNFAFEKTMTNSFMPRSAYSSYNSYESKCTSDDGQPALEAEAIRLNNAESIFCDIDTPASFYCPYSTASTPSSIAIDRMCAAYEQYIEYFGQSSEDSCDAINAYAKESAMADNNLPATFDNDEGSEEYERTVEEQFAQVKENGCLYPFESGFICPYFCGYSSMGDCEF
ncbi:hypothetical protein SARC_04283 [Sphaeroforma arctica JP610]|uniref:Uncharacterized protein n=1 Tax=Sphaeroforma arctica JP610 TaxID=667725 RepID=A0A0L0G3N7_9EUKA|nr:hypothetical protein SARC_04283 [Sphaeroforma arctica JP610]KNC83474.1 hypothetical protein SARC_04283 [Sphaeroforma arctica JP610]|eukprot:XP_014157376.1 hypothetical protein SARC_04283 [Sphaeroforma arctica JP610]